ncbi:MAG: hypothetical protein JST92_27735, partial [Deltaproteobacteria bacterium]|nr:hypothetical protein [Deltaproteobacteria bacterium]
MRLGAAWALVCALGGLSGTARAGEDAPPQGSAAAKGRPASDEKTKATPAPEPGKKPGAHLHVPESIRRGRSTQDEDEPKTLFELGPPEVMNALGPMRLTPGAWVEYGMRLLGHEATRVRFSVLAPAPAEGKVWLEIVTASAIGMPTAVRMLVHGDPNDPRNVERMFVLVAGQAPMELPADEGET